MDYGINPQQLAVCVIRPALSYIGMHSLAAEQLVLGTALTESLGMYVKQLGKGPALGLWQMEPATHDDILGNYVAYKPQLKLWLGGLSTSARITDGALELIGNLFYGAAMCRIHYARGKDALPASGNADGMARMWKKVYNTVLGAGTVEKALPHFRAACAVQA